ncbi:MAG: hypothetical protein ACHQLQ_01025 [Candidatus Acidiferrales bacterium]
MTSTISHGFVRGSKLQIRRLINDDPQRIEEQLRKDIPGWGTAKFDWRSPLVSEQYSEYCDEEFLAVLGLQDYSEALAGGFWPRRGPNWDALARVALPHSAVLLIEAKSHRSEMASCYGGGRKSLKIIEAAFHKTQEWLQPHKHREWTSPFYQFANRLAHLYFLRKECGLEAWLAHVYFTGDPYYPTSREQWDDWLREVRFELGIGDGKIEGLVDVFLAVNAGGA